MNVQLKDTIRPPCDSQSAAPLRIVYGRQFQCSCKRIVTTIYVYNNEYKCLHCAIDVVKKSGGDSYHRLAKLLGML